MPKPKTRMGHDSSYMMSVPISLAIQRAGLSEHSHPALWQWWLRIRARPSCQRAHKRSPQAAGLG
ncbi:MAG: hypothetical protein ACTJHL_02195 [Neisseriaceae bacterium]